MFSKLSKLDEPLGESNLIVLKTSRVPIIYELYEKIVRFFVYNLLYKILGSSKRDENKDVQNVWNLLFIV